MIGYFCPKNTFLQLRHIQRIYLTLFSTTCAKIRQMTYVIFETSRKKKFFWKKSFFTTQLLCIFLTQTLHTFYKSSTSKCKFSDFPLLALKITKFLMSFFKQKTIFLQSLDLFSVSWKIILLYFFSWNFICCHWEK